MPTHKADLAAVYQIKIVLLGTTPPIWRRVLVPGDLSLAQLHNVVQTCDGPGGQSPA